MNERQILIQVPTQSVAAAQAGCAYQPPWEPPNPISHTADSVGALGSAVDAAARNAEHKTGKRITVGTNGKIYRNFNGNQYVTTFRVIRVMEKVGVGTFLVATVVEGYDLWQAYQDPNANQDGRMIKTAKYGLTVMVGVVGLAIGGAAGIVLGVVYFVADKFGLVDKVVAAIYNEVNCNIVPAVSEKVEDIKRANNNFWWQFERELMNWLTRGQSQQWGW
jgi:hypothetical protein